MKFSSEPPTAALFFVGEIETSRLKFSSEIKNFDRDQKFRSGSNFFDRWALWVCSGPVKICSDRPNLWKFAPLISGKIRYFLSGRDTNRLPSFDTVQKIDVFNCIAKKGLFISCTQGGL